MGLAIRNLLWGLAVASWIGLVYLGFRAATTEKPQIFPEPGFPVPTSEFLDQTGATVTLDSLEGRYWLVDFVFTRCGSICPILTQKFESIQDEIPEDVHLVSITVDPEYDIPEVLTAYAAAVNADPDRWHFLGGDPETVYEAIGPNGFKIGAQVNEDAPVTDRVTHSPYILLIDPQGFYVKHYDGMADGVEQEIIRDAKVAVQMAEQKPRPDDSVAGLPVAMFPELNACMNGIAGTCLWIGFLMIKQGKRKAHIGLMISALIFSVLFLAGYLTYHAYHGTTYFIGPGREIYLGILLVHTVLAATLPFQVVPMVVFARRGQYERHMKIARWALPIWLFVSATGVIVYLLLYRLSASVAG